MESIKFSNFSVLSIATLLGKNQAAKEFAIDPLKLGITKQQLIQDIKHQLIEEFKQDWLIMKQEFINQIRIELTETIREELRQEMIDRKSIYEEWHTISPCSDEV
jgi:hypothetical protein